MKSVQHLPLLATIVVGLGATQPAQGQDAQPVAYQIFRRLAFACETPVRRI